MVVWSIPSCQIELNMLDEPGTRVKECVCWTPYFFFFFYDNIDVNVFYNVKYLYVMQCEEAFVLKIKTIVYLNPLK